MDWARHAWTPGALLCALCCRQTPGARQRASRRRLLPGSGVSSRRGRRMRGHHDELHFVHGHPEAAKPVTPHKSSLTKCNARTGPLRVQSTAFEAHLNNTETIGERRETLDANFDCRCVAGCCAGWLRDSTGTGLLRRGLLPSWVLLLIRTGSRSMRDNATTATMAAALAASASSTIAFQLEGRKRMASSSEHNSASAMIITTSEFWR
jgi:hypothetical protein